jgi:hypothetical protein
LFDQRTSSFQTSKGSRMIKLWIREETGKEQEED